MNELSAEKLLEVIKGLRGEENRVLAELIRYLAEAYKRRAFAELGYASLFSLCREALGYSEGAAWRRVSAAKLMLDMPELYGQIASGELSLCAISEIARVKEADKRVELTRASAGKSKREVQSLVAAELPAQRRSRKVETVRAREVEAAPPMALLNGCTESGRAEGGAPVAREKLFTITLELTEEEMAQVEELQRLLSARKVKDALLQAAKKLSKKYKRVSELRDKRLKKREEAVQGGGSFPLVETSRVAKPSRYIPADVRHAVEKRDGCQCTFVSPDGRRCSERRNLQFDHFFRLQAGLNAIQISRKNSDLLRGKRWHTIVNGLGTQTE